MHAWLPVMLAAVVAAAGGKTKEPPKGSKAPAASASKTSIMVLPIENKAGISQDVADMATAIMVGELRKVPGYQVVMLAEVENAMSMDMRRQVSGCDGVSCAAEIAGALNVDQIVIGQLGKIGAKNYVLNVTRVSARDAQAVGSSVRRIPGVDEGVILDVIPAMSAELFSRTHTGAPSPTPAPPPPAATPPPPAATPPPAAAAAPEAPPLSPPAAATASEPAPDQKSGGVLAKVLMGVGAVGVVAAALPFLAGLGSAIAAGVIWAVTLVAPQVFADRMLIVGGGYYGLLGVAAIGLIGVIVLGAAGAGLLGAGFVLN